MAALAHHTVPASRRLRLLSYNIQTGLSYSRYGHYVTRSWKHLVPVPSRWRNLDGIAERLRPYHVVGIQETDSGSLRTGYLNQTEYLAQASAFPFWFDQTNREIAGLARHANGLLSRFRPHRVVEYPLPGPKGRGALVALYGDPSDPLAIVVLHLALGRRARMRQLLYLSELVNTYRHAIVMGDLNCEPASPEVELLLRETSLRTPQGAVGTFPSWQPRRRIDHIFATPEIRIERIDVPAWRYSDHLPIAAEVVVPPRVLPGMVRSAGI